MMSRGEDSPWLPPLLCAMWRTKRCLFLMALPLSAALLVTYVLFGIGIPLHLPNHHHHHHPPPQGIPEVVRTGDHHPQTSAANTNSLRQQENGTLTFSEARQGGSSSSSSPPQPVLRIVVLTYRRAQSLERCLRSLNAALYDGLPVQLEIHVDRARDQSLHNLTVHTARNFPFRHGPVKVYVRPRHGGVVGQWLSSWRVPRDNVSEMAVFIEDDLTVSPFFARWLRRVHDKYDSYPGISGYSLQGETMRHAEGTDSSLMRAPRDQVVFLYPVVGSWGFSPNTGVWRDFIRWYHQASQQDRFLPLVPGLKPSSWYQTFARTGRTESVWTMWHIYYSFKNHQYTLYPHLADGKGLAFNWKEPGEHYNGGPMGRGLRARLLDHWPEEALHLPETLVILDVKGKVMGQRLSPSGLQG